MKDSVLRLTAQRDIAYTDIGDPHWPCAIFLHGAPSSRLRIAYLESAFQARRIRVVSPDRPSYGGSSPHPARTITDWASDVIALADSLNLERFIVSGHSSGGPYALACAAAYPDRVAAAVVLAGVTDMAWPGAWEGYLEGEAQLMQLPTEEAVVAECQAQFGTDGSRFFSGSGIALTGPDERLYSDADVARLLALSRAEAFRQGVAGYAQDVFVQRRPWSFDARAIKVPVIVAHGDSDTWLPLAHSRHTAELIPGSTLHILADHGHLTILAELPALAAHLVTSPPSLGR